MKTRNCLKCRQPFETDKNYICPGCTKENAKLQTPGRTAAGSGFRRAGIGAERPSRA